MSIVIGLIRGQDTPIANTQLTGLYPKGNTKIPAAIEMTAISQDTPGGTTPLGTKSCIPDPSGINTVVVSPVIV